MLFGKITIAVSLVVGLGPALIAQDQAPQRAKPQESKKQWKDRAEYDLYESMQKTQDPNQWLTILDKWKAQYPTSDFADLRRQLYLATYRSLNRPRDAFDAAQEVLKDNADHLVALSAATGYIYQLVPFGVQQLTPQQSSDLDAAQKAATHILDNLDTIYLKQNRPPDMTDEQAAKAKPELKTFAQKTLGYVALENKDYAKAQTELTKALELDPNQGQVSFWLGTAVLAQNKANPGLQADALYDFARAAGYNGPGSLPEADRNKVLDYLNKVYTQYHGSSDGMDQLLASAKTTALPPAGFTIKSGADVERERAKAEAADERAHPMLTLWKRVKQELQSDGGAGYFENNMKGALLPGGVEGVQKFKGTLISMTPAVRPKELVLAIGNSSTPDATLKLESPCPGKWSRALRFPSMAWLYPTSRTHSW